MRKTLANGTLQTDIADYEQAGSASYVTAFNQNFSIIEEKVLQNQISILDSVISIVLAVLVLLWMNPLIAIISTVAMAIPSLLPHLFTKALGKAQKMSWNRQRRIMKRSAIY
jgi:ABC-type multidrug transport system fused ATPase/permease subunit